MIVKKIKKEEYNLAVKIYNESFNKNTINIKLPLLGDLLGLYENNNLIGIIQIDYINDIMDNKKYAIINNFCIKNEYRNKGYGALITNIACQKSEKGGKEKIMLYANNANKSAISAFKKAGFEHCGDVFLIKS